MRLKRENPELGDIVKSYNLRGFSFREYLNLKIRENMPIITLDDILRHKEQIVNEILARVNPQEFFMEYIHHGF